MNRKLFAFGAALFILFGLNAHAQGWQSVNFPTDAWLHSVDFPDSLHGWIAGSGGTQGGNVIWHTADGGLNWEHRDNGITTSVSALTFLDTLNGWAVGDHNGSSGVVYKTADGGQQWVRVDDGTFSPLLAVIFADPLTGWVSGMYSFVAYTTDGGETWDMQHPGTDWATSYHGLDCFNADTCWIAGSNERIFVTHDGGDSWLCQDSISNAEYFDLDMVDRTHGWAAGNDHMIMHTSNGGLDWVQQPASTWVWFGDVAAVDSSTAWVAGFGGVIFGTTDGGATWTQTPTGVSNELYSLCFTSRTNGWAVGQWGTVLYYGGPVHVSRERDRSLLPDCSLTVYPNPFNPTASVDFELAVAGLAELQVYDVTGRMVRTLEDRVLLGGKHRVTLDAAGLSTGTYVVRLQSGLQVAERKLVLVR